ncbi:hypothetical protein BD560DRAFT_392276, partial [Blakeslea trispora]
LAFADAFTDALLGPCFCLYFCLYLCFQMCLSKCAYPNVPIQMCLSKCILTVFTASEPPYTFSDCLKKSFFIVFNTFSLHLNKKSIFYLVPQ